MKFTCNALLVAAAVGRLQSASAFAPAPMVTTADRTMSSFTELEMANGTKRRAAAKVAKKVAGAVGGIALATAGLPPAARAAETAVESVKGARNVVTLGAGAFAAGIVTNKLFVNEQKKASTKSTAGKDITKSEVRALFHLWNNALATGDSRIVASRYAKNPVLLPTVSDVPRTDFAGLKDYFDGFLQKQPQGKILSGDIRIGDGWCQDAGIYEFTMGATGDVVQARYSYVYVYEGGQWKIAHHHSSVMPEGIDIAQPITEPEVRGLFHLWNDALATLDPDAVAKRYAKEGVLLPTVSDVPRTDYDSIKDYFVNFLQKKPQGTILESNVMIGTNWCQDAGIYEFDLLGDKVKARYSFIYKYEDGEWKIAHHHSSVMPEAQLAGGTIIGDAEVRGLFSLWNDALATLDPDTVAKRYSKKPCLLPTVSDTPRDDYDKIRAYFVDFLQKKPQGKILESWVTSGPDWCMDDGIYEFTMGATGDVVKARYSFVYTLEDGEWKIAHHHSSQMPEEIVPKAMLEEAQKAMV